MPGLSHSASLHTAQRMPMMTSPHRVHNLLLLTFTLIKSQETNNLGFNKNPLVVIFFSIKTTESIT